MRVPEGLLSLGHTETWPLSRSFQASGDSSDNTGSPTDNPWDLSANDLIGQLQSYPRGSKNHPRMIPPTLGLV